MLAQRQCRRSVRLCKWEVGSNGCRLRKTASPFLRAYRMAARASLRGESRPVATARALAAAGLFAGLRQRFQPQLAIAVIGVSNPPRLPRAMT